MLINRRKMLRRMAAAAVATPLLPSLAKAATGKRKPKRIIFFLQNQGFDPKTCIPAGMTNSGSLAKAKLPEPIEALEPYKERLHIINGLHGMHTSPSHSAFFGALGGYRGSDGVPPSGPTIDYELSKVLPENTPSALVYRHGFYGKHEGQAYGREPLGKWCGPAYLHALQPEPPLSDALRRHLPR